MDGDFALHALRNMFWKPKTGVQEQLWGDVSHDRPTVMALPNTAASHSTQPEKQGGNRDGATAQG